MRSNDILSLIKFFSMLSLLSVGGSNSVVPEMSRHAVDEQHWITSATFADIFAISQAAPGPSNLIVALIGYKVSGFWGAVAAQAAMMLPAGILMVVVSHIWFTSAHSRWHTTLERALGPIVVGLVLASAWTIAQGAELSFVGYVVMATSTILFWKSTLNPMFVIVLGGILGWLGFM